MIEEFIPVVYSLLITPFLSGILPPPAELTPAAAAQLYCQYVVQQPWGFVVPFCAPTAVFFFFFFPWKKPQTKPNRKKCQFASFFLFMASHILFGHPDTLFDAAASMTRESGQKELFCTY